MGKDLCSGSNGSCGQGAPEQGIKLISSCSSDRARTKTRANLHFPHAQKSKTQNRHTLKQYVFDYDGQNSFPSFPSQIVREMTEMRARPAFPSFSNEHLMGQPEAIPAGGLPPRLGITIPEHCGNAHVSAIEHLFLCEGQLSHFHLLPIY